MSEELRVQVPFVRLRRGLHVTFQTAGEAGAPGGPPTPMALCLGRAHALDRAMETLGPGALSQLGAQWQVSRQRLAAVHALVYLAPDLQEKVLMGSVEATRVNFHELLRITRLTLWADQRVAWNRVVEGKWAGAQSRPGRKGGSGNTAPPFSAPEGGKKPRMEG